MSCYNVYPIVLYNMIFDYIDFYPKHKFRLMCGYMSILFITDMRNIDKKYVKKLNKNVSSKYRNVTKLDISNNT